jgi:hypothetical protein
LKVLRKTLSLAQAIKEDVESAPASPAICEVESYNNIKLIKQSGREIAERALKRGEYYTQDEMLNMIVEQLDIDISTGME